MLRNAIDGFLASATERQLDLPLLLLPAMGFHDVHLTHGPTEFGKDFVAKKREGDATVQYVVQSKAGNIDQAAWRAIQPQIIEAATSTLSHPNFDPALPRQIVLATSGDLTGNAPIAAQDLSSGLFRTLGLPPLLFWGGQNLADFFLEHGLSGVHRATAAGFAEHGQFFLAYAHALDGALTHRDVEEYARRWADAAVPLDRRLLRAAVEAELLAAPCADRGNYWEAVTLHLALLRVLCAAAYTDPGSDTAEAFAAGVARLYALGEGFLAEIRGGWGPTRDLLATPFGTLDVTTYPVHCARVAELAGLVYFTAPDDQARAEASAFLADFVRTEPGCAHPVGDRAAISLVVAALALADAGRRDAATDLARSATVWLCDRYQHGMGLAGFGADEAEETRTLLGYPFDFVALPQRRGSFLATALSDLVAFLGDADLYEAVVNDVKACKIAPQYFRPSDTVGACFVEADDVLQFPAVAHEDGHSPFAELRFANHITDESPTFRFAEAFGPTAALLLGSLLRDRYFPRSWPALTPRAS